MTDSNLTPKPLRATHEIILLALLGALQGAVAAVLSGSAALTVGLVIPAGGRSPLGSVATGSLALVTSIIVATWLRARQLARRRDAGNAHAREVHELMVRRLDSMPVSAPERAAGRSSIHRFQDHLDALSEWVASGPAGAITTGSALLSAVLLLGIWLPGAAFDALLTVIALIAAALAHGAGVRRARHASSDASPVESPRIGPLCAGIIAASGIAIAVTGLTLMRGLVTEHISVPAAAASVTLAASFLPQVLDALRVPAAYRRRRDALRIINRWLEHPTLLRATSHAPALVRGPGRLEFRDAGVLGCLGGLTASAEPGSVIAISGADVIARSTALALAGRLLDPDLGHVYLDGQDLSCHSEASAHQLVALVGPRRLPSEGTVETELLTGRDATPGWIKQALGWCEIDNLIDELPDGSVTKMSDKRLTAGQRLRLSLAHALLRRPSLLLVDETVEPLDALAIAALERVMNGYPGTVLLITQSLDHVAMADSIWYFEGGRLLESGPPSVLLAFDGPTARLFGLGTVTSA